MTEAQRRSIRKYKEKVKLRIQKSNEAELKGLLPDPWVVSYRLRNNNTKAKWKAKQPKSEYVPKANSGSFKKGHTRTRRYSQEEKIIAIEHKKLREKRWREQNKTRINSARVEYMKNNPNARIAANLRKRLSFLFKKASIDKTTQTFVLLGCDLNTLVEHLKSQFKQGMTLSNYGEWHIDHKIPCSSFDLTKTEDQERCFHYLNLQPLWASDNLSKSNKLV